MAPYDPPDAHYAHIDLSQYDKESLNKIVGRRGYNLYGMTKRHKLKYVWLDFETKRLELWGSYKNFLSGVSENILKDIETTIKSDPK